MHSHAGGTRGTETSKYPEEEKEISIFQVAASERERAQTGVQAPRGSDCQKHCGKLMERSLEEPAGEGESPVHESGLQQTGSRVPRDTWNPAGRWEDHLLRLNTTQ